MKTTQSSTLTSAITRIAGVLSIAADLDLGNGLTVESYQTSIAEVDTLVNSFNTQVAQLGELRNRITEKETVLKDFLEQSLLGYSRSWYTYHQTQWCLHS